MKRRHFLKGIALSTGVAVTSPLLEAADSRSVAVDAKIRVTSIEPILLKAARHCPAWTWVRIRTDQGVEGIGEGFAWSGRAARILGYIEQLGDALQGKSPLRIQAFVQRALAKRPRHVQDWGAAISAIEIALWDILLMFTLSLNGRLSLNALKPGSRWSPSVHWLCKGQ